MGKFRYLVCRNCAMAAASVLLCVSGFAFNSAVLADGVDFSCRIMVRPVVSEPEFETITKAAHGGDRKAQFELGMIYFQGRPGVTPDMPQALSWLKCAVKNGSVDAARKLGMIYAQGYGVERDFDLALKFVEPAAQAGDYQARWDCRSIRKWKMQFGS